MKDVKKDIFGKEIETYYANASETKVIDNLQKQLTSLYLFLERKGLLNDENFKDFTDSRELAESIEKLNQPDEQMYPRSNSFVYIIYKEENTEYRDANINSLVSCAGSRKRFMKDELTGNLYDLDDTDDVRKFVEELNKRLKD